MATVHPSALLRPGTMHEWLNVQYAAAALLLSGLALQAIQASFHNVYKADLLEPILSGRCGGSELPETCPSSSDDNPHPHCD